MYVPLLKNHINYRQEDLEEKNTKKTRRLKVKKFTWQQVGNYESARC